MTFLFIVGILAALVGLGILVGGVSAEGRRMRWPGAIVLVIGLGLMFAVTFRVIKATEVAVPIKLGKPGAALDNGPKLVAPWTKLARFSTTSQSQTLEKVRLTGSDGGVNIAKLITRYRITIGGEGCSVVDLFKTIRSEELLEERVVRGQSEQVARDVFRTLPGFVGYTTGQAPLRADAIAKLGDVFQKNCLQLDDFLIVDMEPDPTVAGAAAKAQEASIAIDTATKRAQEQKVAAEGDAQAAITKANGQVEAASKQAEANRILTESLTPEVLASQWIDAIEKSQNRIIITDGDTPTLTLPIEGS
jgi:regulator of protease activity HflC (stomatin/prohibitin superfamily)